MEGLGSIRGLEGWVAASWRAVREWWTVAGDEHWGGGRETGIAEEFKSISVCFSEDDKVRTQNEELRLGRSRGLTEVERLGSSRGVEGRGQGVSCQVGLDCGR